MKFTKHIFAGLVLSLGAAALGSCTGDLDVPPKDPNQLTPEKFAEDPDGYLDRGIAEVMQGATTAGPWGPGNTMLGFGDAGAGTFTSWQQAQSPTGWQASWHSRRQSRKLAVWQLPLTSDSFLRWESGRWLVSRSSWYWPLLPVFCLARRRI